ncbi:MAG: efflux RND transporter periplasmic adaptor subunit [Kiritimatiellae bacterium]|jgi:cobalt-zinc-cadmium efflux system membrane fusion protein|nr:efflux RND transporter periplasmic adaptor subunit [Kiritimatiellia bacterium]
MNRIFYPRFKSFQHQTSALTLGLLLSIGLTAHAQSHDGHEHAAEVEQAESHQPHAGHDDHAAKEAPLAPAADGHEGHDEHEDGEVVRVDPDVLREFDIVVGTVGPGVLHEEVILPGEIQFNAETLAYATPRYAGTVTDIGARLAAHVKKGQVLATLESSETLRPFEVKAPFDGTVVAYDLTPGQTVDAGTPLFTIANLDTVWADLRIYQRDLFRVKKGQRVRIEGGHEDLSMQSEIDYVAPTVDEHTRTGLARVILDNTKRTWKPGQFIKGSVSIEEHAVDLLVPRSAVLTFEGNQSVFVQTEEGFEPRPVRLGHSDATSLEVTSGLKAGDTIVLRNPISLKAELGKGSFGGHNH